MSMHPPLPRSFYRRPVRTVARQLLGKVLVRRSGRELLSGVIVEVEAYGGSDDPASHAFRGRTPRNEVMFGEGGHLYVYFTYGMHFCANVVTGQEGTGCAVLLRALEPLEGIAFLARRRKQPLSHVRELLSGPAKLCQAMDIARPQNGVDLCGDEIWIEDRGIVLRPRDIASTPRIGITQGKEHLWRYVLRDSAFLSRPVR
jgi:DNA-3-methyladenine glycosylase